MAVVAPRRSGPGRSTRGRPGRTRRRLARVRCRVRVDGKFFARGGQRLRVQGVTYGPFAPDADGEPFPAPERVARRLRPDAGRRGQRDPHLPRPAGLAPRPGRRGTGWPCFVDVPWPKHLCFLDSDAGPGATPAQAVRRAAKRGRDHPCVLAYSIGNEIPPDVVRWHGARRVERFLAELADVVKQADPDGLVTYANFPPTEYLDLSFLDFATFNVYLHDREAFRRYLFRLQNLVGDRPLLLGELGMDTLRHGELEQAEFLAGHLREARLMGLAGAFVFSWTDDWHTGGHPIEDWAFGITHADRSPKAVLPRPPRGVRRARRPTLLAERPAGVGGRLHVQRRADARPVPAVAADARLPRLRGDRRRRRLDRRHAGRSSPGSRRCGPSTSRTGA